MGGGDLNLKKSWHPHTMKNQEKVWKAEQSKNQEEKKLKDLRKEIEDERNREELRKLGESTGVLNQRDQEKMKLEWMYKSSTELINREEYLLGRSVDKSFEKLQEEEKLKEKNIVGIKQPINHVEHECVPFSIRSYRGLQSTEQVDLQRKVLEDPLMLIKQREMESRRKILENPVKLKELHRILKTDEKLRRVKKPKKSKKAKKSKKSHKKHTKSRSDSSTDENSPSDSDEDLDRKLAKQFKRVKSTLTDDNDFEGLELKKILDAKYETLSKGLDKALAVKKILKRTRKSCSKSGSQKDERGSHRRRNEKKAVHSRAPQDRKHGKDDERGSHGLDWKRTVKKTGRFKSPQDSKYNTARMPSRSRSRSPDPSRQRNMHRTRSPVDNREHTSHYGNGRRSRSCESKRMERKPRHSNSPQEKQQHSSHHRETRRTPSRERERPRKIVEKRQERSRSPVQRRNVVKEPKREGFTTSNKKLTEEEKEARRREMMENAAWREADRYKAVKKQREELAREEENHKERDFDKEFINKQVKKAIANQTSVGSRIRSNLNNIQRTSAAMDSNFARK